MNAKSMELQQESTGPESRGKVSAEPMAQVGQRKSAPPVMAFIGMFLSAKEVFGQEMPPDFLIERVRSYGWKGSISRLAQLAAYVQHPGREVEDVRRRTIDPILQITGDRRAQSDRSAKPG